MRPTVYILASQRNGTLYVGVTSDPVRRIWEHKTGAAEGFTRDHTIHILVYIEFHETMEVAILREKRIKRWRREWKRALIEKDNPTWRDLYQDLAL